MVRYDEPPPFPHTKIGAIAIPVDILRVVVTAHHEKNGFIGIKKSRLTSYPAAC
jgi:hypothetical protein